MFAKVAFFCAALVAVSAYAPLVNTGVSATSSTQDAEVGKVGSVAVAAPAVYGALWRPSCSCLCCAPAVAASYAVPTAWLPTLPPSLGRPCSLYGGIAAPVLAGRVAYGGYSAPVAYGGVLGHGAALGLGYGAGIYGAGLGKAIY
ncbi:hypothetical protein CEXT_436611 [Caerostris extrusa]|uniref:Uncharacterized protein n=1 Tax=Caerostris extrusa TaxID=172846 RepID=A0AAV4WIM1_CAEEX|nr:hypothetical protein CEXT_436611 [Caerostris extrusa]